MLSFANPWAFALLGFLVPVVLLYFLRMRFKRQPVGSAFIWRMLADKNSGGNRFKVRSLLLLLLQAAAVVLAALAASGPSLESRRLLKPGTAIVIDASASMACVDPSSPGLSRLERAKREAARALRALPAGTPAMLIAGSSAPERLWSGSAGPEGAKAIEAVKQEEGAFLEDEAVLAIAPELARRQGAWRALVYTDGGLDLGGRRLAAAFEGAIEFANLGEPAADSGITGLSVAASGAKAQASFTLINEGPAAIRRAALLSFDGAELARSELDLPPGRSRASLALPGAARPGAYRVRLEGSDAYAENDSAYFALAPERAVSVLVVGRSDPYIAAALAFQGIQATSADALPDKVDAEDWDFVVVNGQAARPGLRANAAFFGDLPEDAPAQERYTVSGYLSAPASDHPLSRFLEWEDGARALGKALELGPGAQAIASVKDAPVMIAWEKDGFRYFASSVDMASSDLGMSQAFPVLMRNLIQWFVPGAAGFAPPALRVGEGAWLSEGASLSAEDKRVSISMTGTRARVTARAAGVFAWKAAGRSGYLAANLPESELDPGPRSIAQPEGRPSLSSAFSARSQSFAGPPVLLLLVCLAAEWLLWSGLPALKSAKRKEAAR